jgi:hypothetical protein
MLRGGYNCIFITDLGIQLANNISIDELTLSAHFSTIHRFTDFMVKQHLFLTVCLILNKTEKKMSPPSCQVQKN